MKPLPECGGVVLRQRVERTVSFIKEYAEGIPEMEKFMSYKFGQEVASFATERFVEVHVNMEDATCKILAILACMGHSMLDV